MHHKHCPALEAYFIDLPTADELANKVWSKFNMGTEKALGEVIAGVINTTGDRRWVACKNSTQYSVAPDRVKTTNKTADVVLLTHAAVAHDPTLPNVWDLPSHANDAGPDTNVNSNASENGKGQHHDENNNAEQDSTNMVKDKDDDETEAEPRWT